MPDALMTSAPILEFIKSPRYIFLFLLVFWNSSLKQVQVFFRPKTQQLTSPLDYET